MSQSLFSDSLDKLMEEEQWPEAQSQLLQLAQSWKEQFSEEPTEGNAIEWAKTLLFLGMVEDHMGEHDSANTHLEKAHATFTEFSLLELKADTEDALGKLHVHQTAFSEAEKWFEQSLATRRSIQDSAQEIWIRATKDHMADLYLRQGRYEEAGNIIFENLDLTENNNTEQYILRLSNAAYYYFILKRFSKSEEFYDLALTKAEQSNSKQLYFSLLEQYALILDQQGFSDSAENLLRKALQEQGSNSLKAINLRNNLATIQVGLESWEDALHNINLAIQETIKLLGEKHPSLGYLWNNKAIILQNLDQHDKAHQYFKQSIQLYETVLEPYHLELAKTKHNTAINSFLNEKISKKNRYEWIQDAAKSQLETTYRLATFGTEQQRLQVRQHLDPISLLCTEGFSAENISNYSIQTKGLIFDSLITEETPNTLTYRKNVSWQQVVSSLPEQSVFIDYIRYTDYSTKDQESKFGAIILTKNTKPQWLPLCTEKALSSWTQSLQNIISQRLQILSGQSLESTSFITLQKCLQEIYQLIISPILSSFDSKPKTVAISPDGLLHTFPFAVLLNPENQFFCEEIAKATFYSFPIDLLQPPLRKNTNSSLLLSIQEHTPILSASKILPSPILHHDLLKTLETLTPIPGVNREATMLKKSLKPQILDDETASEEFLTQMAEAPKILHLATHGFFFANEKMHSEKRLQVPHLDFDANPSLPYQSLLLLGESLQSVRELNQNSKLSSNRQYDGFLFPQEASNLNLLGTELVTASACHSGLGISLNNEGMIGLRRAFSQAGAQNTLLTLWALSDASTPAFMKAFYHEATHSQDYSGALWNTQRKQLKNIKDRSNTQELETAIARFAPFMLTSRTKLTNYQEPSFFTRYTYEVMISIVALILIVVFFSKKPFSK